MRITNGEQIAKERAYLELWQASHVAGRCRTIDPPFTIEHYREPFSPAPFVAGFVLIVLAALALGAAA